LINKLRKLKFEGYCQYEKPPFQEELIIEVYINQISIKFGDWSIRNRDYFVGWNTLFFTVGHLYQSRIGKATKGILALDFDELVSLQLV